MNRRKPAKFVASAIVGAVAFSTSQGAWAQVESTGPGQPRSTNERNVTGQATPPPVNSDYRKAAEGALPAAPGQIPVPREGNGVPNGAAAIDPAARVVVPQVAYPAQAIAPGLDVAMLVEHALGMAIEASALQAIGEQAPQTDSARMLLDHSKHMMKESKDVLTRAAADGKDVDAGSPTRRFYSAANAYMTTLSALNGPASLGDPVDKAQVALINHAVKGVLDSGHIRQFGHAYASTPATEQLLAHARAMKDMGMATVLKMVPKDPVDPSASASAAMLAQNGRDLLEAADRVAAIHVPAATPRPKPTAALPADPNPGRFQDGRPEIIGGTFATGSPSTGTVTGPQAADAYKGTVPLTGGLPNPAIPDTSKGAPLPPK